MNKNLSLLIAVVVALVCALPGHAKGKRDPVSDNIAIDAPASAVWKAVTSADKFDASVSSSEGNEAVVEQAFEKIPFYGTVKTTLKVTVKPGEVLSYEMIKSDKLKEMSGSWVLTPINKNKTHLKLTSSVDPGLPVPRFLINHFIKGKVHSRLEKTRKLAESYGSTSQQ